MNRSILARIRWANLALALLVLTALVLVLTWPSRPPALPGQEPPPRTSGPAIAPPPAGPAPAAIPVPGPRRRTRPARRTSRSARPVLRSPRSGRRRRAGVKRRIAAPAPPAAAPAPLAPGPSRAPAAWRASARDSFGFER